MHVESVPIKIHVVQEPFSCRVQLLIVVLVPYNTTVHACNFSSSMKVLMHSTNQESQSRSQFSVNNCIRNVLKQHNWLGNETKPKQAKGGLLALQNVRAEREGLGDLVTCVT